MFMKVHNHSNVLSLHWVDVQFENLVCLSCRVDVCDPWMKFGESALEEDVEGSGGSL